MRPYLKGKTQSKNKRYLWVISGQILKFYFLVIKKPRGFYNPLQTCFHTHPLTKNFLISKCPRWFLILSKICPELIRKCQIKCCLGFVNQRDAAPLHDMDYWVSCLLFLFFFRFPEPPLFFCCLI